MSNVWARRETDFLVHPLYGVPCRASGDAQTNQPHSCTVTHCVGLRSRISIEHWRIRLSQAIWHPGRALSLTRMDVGFPYYL